jgi:hypothetical protein
MTRVTLTPVEPGAYAVRRRLSEHFAPPQPQVLAAYVGWNVTWGEHVAGTFRLVSDARRWLDSAAGQEWLDQLPHLGRDPS